MFCTVLFTLVFLYLYLYIYDFYDFLKVNKEFFDECCDTMELIYETEYNQLYID